MSLTKILDNSTKSLTSSFDTFIKPVILHPYIKIIIIYIAILSVILSLEDLPKQLKKLLVLPIVHLSLIFLSIFVLSGKLKTSIVITLGLIIIYYFFNIHFVEKFANYIYTPNLKK